MQTSRHRFAIALGSNLGDRLYHLREAVRLMRERLPRARLTAAAPIYETAPVDCPGGSGPFYNSVVEIECDATPLEALAILQGIERDLGRPADHGRHAPRTLDLDLLCAGDMIMNDSALTLPHPRLSERRFVLQPLADICPSLVLPGRKESAGELLIRLPATEMPLRLVLRDWV
ncbi:MAG TPA: 2-amino-4-hydroxy-6-hydroxymethyldihydropteridine diphosphokinase [Verrucomicrobiaceae bacterium]